MLKASFKKYTLKFRSPAITSRATMNFKDTYFIKIWNEDKPEVFGVGECALFKGLSADDKPDYEDKLQFYCNNINNLNISEIEYCSIRFGIETALLDLKNGGKRLIFPSKWTEGGNPIQINGLIWMGSYNEMLKRLEEKLELGFNCIKLKIGGIDFNKEIKLLRFIRSNFPATDLQLRLDANGAFSPSTALAKLEQLAKYDIHSIEQPIKQHQWAEMANICRYSPIPIGLDEELIGIDSIEKKNEMLHTINPKYIILKPSLCGGFFGSEQWIELANNLNIGWWATSALESNIGLNAIAQWVSTHKTKMPQGLGTGNLYANNIVSPICQIDDILTYNINGQWDIPSQIL